MCYIENKLTTVRKIIITGFELAARNLQMQICFFVNALNAFLIRNLDNVIENF